MLTAYVLSTPASNNLWGPGIYSFMNSLPLLSEVYRHLTDLSRLCIAYPAKYLSSSALDLLALKRELFKYLPDYGFPD
jgi:hypothetical protein